MQPIWWCIVKSEAIEGGRYYAERIVLAIKTTVDQASAMYDQHAVFINTNPGYHTAYFIREPDDSPLINAPDHMPEDTPVVVASKRTKQ